MSQPKASHRTKMPPDPPDPPARAPLKQIQYRSYHHRIRLYHYRDTAFSVNKLRKWLMERRRRYGFVAALVGADLLEGRVAIADGDEMPRGSVEVGHLAGIFPNVSGCALGFRVGGNVIEWFCFRRPIEDSILNKLLVTHFASEIQKEPNMHRDNEFRLFNHVGFSEKGLDKGHVRTANPEHRLWYESLAGARYRETNVLLTWKNKAAEKRKAFEEREKARSLGAEMEEEELVVYEEEDMMEAVDVSDTEEEEGGQAMGDCEDVDQAHNDAMDMS